MSVLFSLHFVRLNVYLLTHCCCDWNILEVVIFIEDYVCTIFVVFLFNYCAQTESCCRWWQRLDVHNAFTRYFYTTDWTCVLFCMLFMSAVYFGDNL